MDCAARVRELVSLVDLLPTFNAIAGIDEAIEPLEGVDLLSLIGHGQDARDVRFMLNIWPKPHLFRSL